MELYWRNWKIFQHSAEGAIDISYTLDWASHIVGRRKLKPDRRRWSFPQLTRSMIICVLCIAEMDKVDNKSCFIQLKSIEYTNAEKYSVFFGIFLMSGNDQYGCRPLL